MWKERGRESTCHCYSQSTQRTCKTERREVFHSPTHWFLQSVGRRLSLSCCLLLLLSCPPFVIPFSPASLNSLSCCWLVAELRPPVSQSKREEQKTASKKSPLPRFYYKRELRAMMMLRTTGCTVFNKRILLEHPVPPQNCFQ